MPATRCHGAGSGGTDEARASARRDRSWRRSVEAGGARDRARRSRAGRRTSQRSSRAGCAGRCRPARRSRNRETPWRARPAGPRFQNEHARATRVSRTAALSPANPAPMTMTSGITERPPIGSSHHAHAVQLEMPFRVHPRRSSDDTHCFSAMIAWVARGTRTRAVKTS